MNSSARVALMQLIEQAAMNANKPANATPAASVSSVASMAPTEEFLSAPAAREREGRTVAELRPRAAVQLSHDMTVAEAAKRMTHANADAALIIGEDDRVDGIFTDRDLATRVLGPQLDPRRTRVGSVMTNSPQCVMDDEPALNAISLMIEGGFRHVPVVDATESVVGLLDVAKCLHDAISSVELGQLEGGHRTGAISSVELGQLEGGHRTVRELLSSRTAVLISPSATVHAAAKLLSSRKDIPALLVAPGPITRPGRACAGILTPKDLLTRVVGVGASAGWVKVEAVMTPDPAMVDEGAPLLTALHLLQGSGFRHLPVVSSDGTHALGVLDVLTLLQGALVRPDKGPPRGIGDRASSPHGIGDKGSPYGIGDRASPPPRRWAAASAAGEEYTPTAPTAAAPPFGTPLAPGFFLFKVSVLGPGDEERLLRLRCAEDSLSSLFSAITAKLPPSDRSRSLALFSNPDDVTEPIPLRNDEELSAAVAAARAAGRDRLLVSATLGEAAPTGAGKGPPTGIVRKLFKHEGAGGGYRGVRVIMVAVAALAVAAMLSARR